MPERDDQTSVSERRNFLKLAGLGTVLGGAAIAAGSHADAAESDIEAGTGYRETAHVKAYYDLSRF